MSSNPAGDTQQDTQLPTEQKLQIVTTTTTTKKMYVWCHSEHFMGCSHLVHTLAREVRLETKV